MKKATSKDKNMREHYDFSGGVRGKYARRYAEGTNIVVLDPDVARLFPNQAAVNETLRAVAQIVQIQARKRGGGAKARALPRESLVRRNGHRKTGVGRFG